MKRPSRGACESAATMRYMGRFVAPTRLKRILTKRESSSKAYCSRGLLFREYDGGKVSPPLEAVVQGWQIAVLPLPFEGQTQQVVGEMGVLGQEGAVEVGAKGVLVGGALRLVLTIVAVACDD